MVRLSDIRLVYFSSVTENTKRFVDKLGFPSERIGMKIKGDFLNVDYPYVLFVPSYKGGANTGAVPRQVINFLNDEQNRSFCIGGVGNGNINFNEDYNIGIQIISQKLRVPVLHRFELMGTPTDVEIVKNGLVENWDELLQMRFGKDSSLKAA